MGIGKHTIDILKNFEIFSIKNL